MGVDGDVTDEGEEGEEVFFSCHSLRLSAAHELHELKYAPAFWPTVLTDAWAWLMSSGGALRPIQLESAVVEAAAEFERCLLYTSDAADETYPV